MTLKRSSRGNESLMKSISKTHTGISALLSLFTFLWFGVFEIIDLNLTRSSWTVGAYGLDGALQKELMHYVGIGSYSYILVWSFAILLGVQGFAFLFDSKKVDFYMSQPVKKMKRFGAIYLNGVLWYLIIMGCGFVLGILVGALRGAFCPAVIPAACFEYFNLFVQFLSLYTITVLATLLCGNLFTAVCSVGFFWFAEIVIRSVVWALCGTFLTTFTDAPGQIFNIGFTSPLINFFNAMKYGVNGYDVRLITFDTVFKSAMGFLPMIFGNLLIALCAFILAYFAFKNRRMEFSGKSVVYGFMEHVYKIVVALIGGVGFALIVINIFDLGTNNKSVSASVIFAGFIGVFVVCVIAEGIFAMNVRKVFNRAWQMAVLAAAVFLIILGFNYDWIGYDRYVPSPKKVEYVSIYPAGSYDVAQNYTIDAGASLLPVSYNSYNNYFEDYVNIPDVEAALEIASIGQKNNRAQKMGDDYVEGEEMIICYKLKGKGKRYRKLLLPNNIDAALMDRMLSEDNYAEAIAGLGQADEKLDNLKYDGEMSVDRFVGDHITVGKTAEMKEFIKLFKQDVDEYYSYSAIKDSDVICNVFFIEDYNSETYDDYSNVNLSFPVYSCYKRSVDYLKSKGVNLDDEKYYQDITDYAKHAQYIMVEKMWSDDTDNSWDVANNISSVNYDDPDEVEAVMKSVDREGFQYYGNTSRMPFSFTGSRVLMVSVFTNTDYGADSSTYRIDVDNAPDFVKRDLNL